MKTILGIDCAVENIGICYVEFNDRWQDDLNICRLNMLNLYENLAGSNQEQVLLDIRDALEKINQVLDSILVIRYFNVFDLIPFDINGLQFIIISKIIYIIKSDYVR